MTLPARALVLLLSAISVAGGAGQAGAGQQPRAVHGLDPFVAPLPRTQMLPAATAESYPFNAAAASELPLDLSHHGYVSSGNGPFNPPINGCAKPPVEGDPEMIAAAAGVPVIEIGGERDTLVNAFQRRPDSDATRRPHRSRISRCTTSWMRRGRTSTAG